jgi:hypothetical protein
MLDRTYNILKFVLLKLGLLRPKLIETGAKRVGEQRSTAAVLVLVRVPIATYLQAKTCGVAFFAGKVGAIGAGLGLRAAVEPHGVETAKSVNTFAALIRG